MFNNNYNHTTHTKRLGVRRFAQTEFCFCRALPMCRECRKKHGRGEPCFRAAFSAVADDADAMPYDEFFRLHLPSPSGAEEHLL